jgi:hypothetical protein
MDVLELQTLQEMADTDVAAGDYLLVVDVSEQESPNGIKKLLVSQAREALRLQAPTAFATDGAITPTVGVATLTKATAGAYTLAAPTAAQDGMVLIITSRTAAAHVVTATGLLEDGVTGGAKNTATFAAFVGASCMLIAINLKWHTVSLKAVTVAA